MNVQVFDTHVTTSDGRYLHFDVLVQPEHAGNAKRFAAQFLASRGVSADQIRQQSCAFCHNEIGTPAVIAAIEAQQYAIIPLQGC